MKMQASLILLLCLAGCGDDGAVSLWPTPAPAPGVGPGAQPAQPGQRPGAQAHAKAVLPQSETDQHTILLCVMRDLESHVRDADYYQKVLTEKLGWKDVFVLHKAGLSEVFWGRYAARELAEKNLRIAKAYRAQNGQTIFGAALIVPMPGKDTGPPEWNLRNAKGAYTLLIAIFQDDPERNYTGRRQKAVDYCKLLRDKGCEGYYYHEPTASHVTIGAFPQNSMTIERLPDGREKMIVNDARITALQTDFPHMAFNGSGINEMGFDEAGRPVRMPKTTYLTAIPKDKDEQ